MPRVFAAILFLLLVVPTVCLGDANDHKLALSTALRDQPSSRLFEITLPDGQFSRGYITAVRNDSLFMNEQESGGTTLVLYLPEILRVRVWQTNANAGAGWGAGSGAVIVGGFGLLVGLYAASQNSDRNNIGPVVGLTMAGAVLGAATGGLLGGGMGALVHSWHEIWPSDIGPPLPLPAPARPPTRLGLFAGLGSTQVNGYEFSRFTGRVSLHRILGQGASLGPDIGYHDFGRPIVAYDNNAATVTNENGIISFSLGTSLIARKSPLAPFAVAGSGWYLGNYSFFGAHIGGGLRWQTARSVDLSLDVRYHFSFAAPAAGQINSFWTLGIDLGFGL